MRMGIRGLWPPMPMQGTRCVCSTQSIRGQVTPALLYRKIAKRLRHQSARSAREIAQHPRYIIRKNCKTRRLFPNISLLVRTKPPTRYSVVAPPRYPTEKLPLLGSAWKFSHLQSARPACGNGKPHPLAIIQKNCDYRLLGKSPPISVCSSGCVTRGLAHRPHLQSARPDGASCPTGGHDPTVMSTKSETIDMIKLTSRHARAARTDGLPVRLFVRFAIGQKYAPTAYFWRAC